VEALGRSRGLQYQIHALTDAVGNPLDFVLTPGQTADITQAHRLLPEASVQALVADKGYDAEPFVTQWSERGIEASSRPASIACTRGAMTVMSTSSAISLNVSLAKSNTTGASSRALIKLPATTWVLRFVAALVWLR
jgi:transposase